MMNQPIHWTEIEPRDAAHLNLHERLDIVAPLNENGERCPWPWEPQQLVGAPLGQYRCGYCGAMCVAGMQHLDYRGSWWCEYCGDLFGPEDKEDGDVRPVCAMCRVAGRQPTGEGGA